MKREGQTFSKRFEKKFLVSRKALFGYFTENQSDFYNHFKLDHFKADSKYTIIKNIYFDDENLSSYHDSVFEKKFRQKVRARTYAENGIKNNLIFFEVKTKSEGVTTKVRVAFKNEWYKNFVEKGYLPLAEVIELNHSQKKEKVLETLSCLREFIHVRKFRPMLVNQYRRQAYRLKTDSKLRLTMDFDLEFEKIGKSISPKQEYKKHLSDDDVIVEAKYKNLELFKKATAVLSQDILGTSKGFSKYCFSISELGRPH